MPEAGQEPILEVEDIQGNVIPGFNKPHQALVFVGVREPATALPWIAHLAARVTSAHDVLEFRRARRFALSSANLFPPSVASSWLNIAFSASGLEKLGIAVSAFGDPAFRADMHGRVDLLGDPIDPTDPAAPANWVVGNGDNVADVIVILGHDTAEGLDSDLQSLVEILPAGLQLIHREFGVRLPAPWEAYEHFGFRDGISQPGVRGRLSENPDVYLQPRHDAANPDQGWPGQDMVWPGEFVFGYRRLPDHPDEPYGPVSTAGPIWSRNGSYLVFRRLTQDTAGFEQFLEGVCTRLRSTFRNFSNLDTEIVASRIFGRWRSGAPLSRTPLVDNPVLGEDDGASDNFQYETSVPPIAGDPYPPAIADPTGLRCPFASHIRKANPRDGGSEGTIKHRILRRGIPFGAPHPDPEEKGMLFVCYQTSIERQFEFIMNQWIVQSNEPVAGAGVDAVMGLGTRVLLVALPDDAGQLQRVALPVDQRFITPSGGGYFFAPSLRAIRDLSAGLLR